MQNTVQQTIDKTSEISTYKFSIKNYVLENDQTTKRISEVDMEYDIQIQNEKENFPIKYELFEEEKNVNLLDENGKTGKINIKAKQEYEKVYSLVVTWDEKSGELSDSNNINIIVNSSQIK